MLISATPFHDVARVLFTMKPSNRNFREKHIMGFPNFDLADHYSLAY